jgi:hypothetical protein
MRRAISCMLPGVIVPFEFVACRHTFLGHNSLQCSKLMVVIGLARIRVTGSVRPLDLYTKCRGPLGLLSTIAEPASSQSRHR